MWKAVVNLIDGATITYNEDSIESNGINIVGEVSQSNNFAIGTCVCREAEISVLDRGLNQNDFYDAVVTLYEDNIRKGIFICNKPTKSGDFIKLKCYDRMILTDRTITDILSGNTLGAIASSACDACGLTLKTATFDGYDIASSVPDVSDMTYRELFGYIAQASGNYVRIDDNGEVEFAWYQDVKQIITGGYFDSGEPSYLSGVSLDGGYFDESTPYASGDELSGGSFEEMKSYRHIYQKFSMTVETDDIVITGVRIKNDDVIKTYGTEDYMISIEDNPLTEGREEYFAQYIGEKVIGLRFRPFNMTLPFDSTIQAGETVYFDDLDGVYYKSFITKVTHTIGSSTSIECNAQTPTRQSSQRKTVETKILMKSKQNTKRQIKTYDQTVQAMTSLITQGFGLYFTKLDDGAGGTKVYMHDKATIEESTVIWTITAEGIMVSNDGTATWAVDTNGNALFNVITAHGLNADWLRVGGQGNGDGSIVVKDSDGNVLIILDNAGITMADGTSLINASGVCGDLTFTSGGLPYDLGWYYNYDSGVAEKQEVFLQAVIPDNYVITSALVTLSTCATYWKTVWDLSGETMVYNTCYGYPRKVKAYVGQGQVYKQADWDGGYGFASSGSFSQIVSGGFTSAGVDGSTTVNPKQTVSGNIKSLLKPGLNTIKFSPEDFTGSTNLSYAERTGTATALLSIKGYTKNS